MENKPKRYVHPERIFKTPEDLYKAFEEYKANLLEEAKKFPKVQYVGKDGNRVVDYLPLPYTYEGFKVFCYKDYGTIRQYFDNKDEYYSEFVHICSRIQEEIRNNQITGGMLGFYNPSITQRLNNLVERVQEDGSKDVTIKVKYERKDSNTESTS